MINRIVRGLIVKEIFCYLVELRLKDAMLIGLSWDFIVLYKFFSDLNLGFKIENLNVKTVAVSKSLLNLRVHLFNIPAQCSKIVLI